MFEPDTEHNLALMTKTEKVVLNICLF